MLSLRKSIRAAKISLISGAAFGAFAFALPLRAQNPPEPVPAAPAPPAAPDKDIITLPMALANAQWTRAGLALAVDADNARLTKEEAAAKALDTLPRIVLAFDEASREFGSVTAIGPQTYTELNTDFSKANAFADLLPAQAFTLLMASLDDRQRSALTSKAGLGLSDLTTPEQKQIFEALLPGYDVSLFVRGASENAPGRDVSNLREKASSAHLRVAQEIAIQAETKGQEYSRADIPTPPGKDSPKIYDLNYSAAYDKKINGVAIRRDVPNHLY